MAQALNRRYSPIEQVQRHQRLVLTESSRPLSRDDEAMLSAVMNGKCDFIPNDAFAARNAERKLFTDAPAISQPDVSWYHPVMDDISSSAKQNKSMGTVLLTAAQERALFLQFNYCRYRVAKVRERIGESPVEPEQAQELLHWHKRAEALRDQIAQTNLALVLAMAKRTRMTDVDFADLVSEGNLALLRAVDKFDAARGFKFSTYACRAILKAFSRTGITLSKYRRLFPTGFDPKYERSDYSNRKRAEHEEDCVDEVRVIINQNRAELTDIEQSVIEHRFGLGRKRKVEPNCKPLTLEQVGRLVGLTKERVRQIQNKALDKVRHSLESEFLD